MKLNVLLILRGGKIVAFTLDSKYINNNTFCGLPVYPFEALEDYVDIEKVEIILTIGYSGMNYLRKQKYQECKDRGFKIHTMVSKNAIVYADNIGEGCIIYPSTYIGPCSTLGKCCVITAGCTLSHHIHIGNYNWIAPGSTYGGNVSQGDFCFIGIGSSIRNSIKIRDRAFIGAHSYIMSDTVEDKVYFGVPAKMKYNMSSANMIAKV